jgi:hypothetical protein
VFVTGALAAGPSALAGKAGGGDDRAAKCAALSECRAAFARCKREYIEKTGSWDLETQPCGERYQACVREHFAPGEMFFTRWFWPYEACP